MRGLRDLAAVLMLLVAFGVTSAIAPAEPHRGHSGEFAIHREQSVSVSVKDECRQDANRFGHHFGSDAIPLSISTSHSAVTCMGCCDDCQCSRCGGACTFAKACASSWAAFHAGLIVPAIFQLNCPRMFSRKGLWRNQTAEGRNPLPELKPPQV
jgi:hypothetical protein